PRPPLSFPTRRSSDLGWRLAVDRCRTATRTHGRASKRVHGGTLPMTDPAPHSPADQVRLAQLHKVWANPPGLTGTLTGVFHSSRSEEHTSELQSRENL